MSEQDFFDTRIAAKSAIRNKRTLKFNEPGKFTAMADKMRTKVISSLVFIWEMFIKRFIFRLNSRNCRVRFLRLPEKLESRPPPSWLWLPPLMPEMTLCLMLNGGIPLFWQRTGKQLFLVLMLLHFELQTKIVLKIKMCCLIFANRSSCLLAKIKCFDLHKQIN